MTRPDPLIEQLRDQARAFAPEPPPGVRRRVFSALAGEVPEPRRAGWVGWSLAGAALVGLVVLGVSVMSRPPAPRGPVAGHQDSARARLVIPAASLAMTDPLSLAHRYLDRPLESEIHTLLEGLTQTRDTVTRVLPAPGPVKRSGAQRRGAGV